ncbi:GDSL-type esterase/lipase family protein [Microbacterium sp. ET2]|uniref:SGNH/GDSL hydrolase family protein n=1 Tax=Microbacterium albipurpureum TaxID=3050384 RepID=UPI00259C8C32|nr:GDSL-type esterase/lipase family protein [Microbacterium sp. ET2 (Ac-2212)]WJL96937.1 GDSL-type esterase/lipase family protein [Microbacterium sp. ET2 (Ac-2212)]
MDIEHEMLVRYVRGIGLSSAPLLDSLGTPPAHQDATVAAMLGIDEGRLASLRLALSDQVEGVADQLLADAAFADDVSRLPFDADERILIVGDSISADAAGWANILAAVLRRTSPRITVLNRAVPGRTTAETLYSLPFAAPLSPTHALVMLGTNDTRRLGSRVGARMASPSESERNLGLIRELLIRQLGVRVVTFITPPPADPGPVATRREGGEWNEPEDLAELAAVIRRLDPAAVDLHGAVRPDDDFFHIDGLHPFAAGQVEMARVIVRLLAAVSHASPR